MMNNEDFERKMEFIVNQQAQFAVDIEKLSEAQLVTQQTLQETNAIVTRLAYVTNEGFKDQGAKINTLVDSQIGLRESLMELRESQRLTDEKLRQLMVTVDRYIRNRHNGR